MNEQILQIAARIAELRDILDMTAAEIAETVGLTEAEYLTYEKGEDDIPIGVLYGVAGALGVDPTVLLTGEDPRMNTYTVVRGGNGVSVKRYDGYSFSSLAYNYIGREMEPMIVDLDPSESPELVTHGGQEFNLVLSGTLCVVFDKQDIVLHEGDSVYFNPAVPHGQRAVGGPARFLTVINDTGIRKK